jgi:hypothetical protein
VGSPAVVDPSGLSVSTEDDLRANRRSRFSWAFRVLSISLRRFSNVLVFLAMLVLLGILASCEMVSRDRPD